MHKLIGQEIMNRRTKDRGTVLAVDNKHITISFDEEIIKYPFPEALATRLLLRDPFLQAEYESESESGSFESFKQLYSSAVRDEISYLHKTGGKRYRAMDGIRLTERPGTYIYSFETDSELHFPDGTIIRIWHSSSIILATVIACEEFSIMFQTYEQLDYDLEKIEFTAEPWQLLEALVERLTEIDTKRSPIAYQLACTGKQQIDKRGNIRRGQPAAESLVTEQPITFVWGPPGTGKTTTLSKIALQFLGDGKRVLMLSYSNVSVDGALLRVANGAENEYPPGSIIRYGYPRVPELYDNTAHSSYQYVLNTRPELKERYQLLREERKKVKKGDPRRASLQKELDKIRTSLREAEQELIQNAPFVATTVSKALVDKAVYSQAFDLVIFDEASMAYIPQIVFASSLAKSHFCCLGDFRQLPAIVQNPDDTLLIQDIFNFTGIVNAVENHWKHNWLVMLDYQYRMHPVIADFVSDSVYEGLLKSDTSRFEINQDIANLAPLAGHPMGLIDLSGTYSVCIKTMDGSRINLLSSMICLRLTEILHTHYNVGLITPYSAQSRLMLAMIRDLQERDNSYKSVSCATVHQFQGSEKSIIIYDAVDCFRMPYPGMLLTSKKNDTANRLFNVALTRTQGKFLMVANQDYLFRKRISKNLMFTEALQFINDTDACLFGSEICDELGTFEEERTDVYLGEWDDEDSWNYYLNDISSAKSSIHMDIPGVLHNDPEGIKQLSGMLNIASDQDVAITIRQNPDISLPSELSQYAKLHPYVTTPVTIIDKTIIWFGEPLSAADFITEGDFLTTETGLCLRFEGQHTARILKVLLEI